MWSTLAPGEFCSWTILFCREFFFSEIQLIIEYRILNYYGGIFGIKALTYQWLTFFGFSGLHLIIMSIFKGVKFSPFFFELIKLV